MLGRIFWGFLSWGLQKNKKIGNDGEWVTMIDIVSGAECAGSEEKGELERAKRHMKEETALQLVERKTELPWADPAPLRKRKGAVREWTEQGTKIPDPEVLYRNLETAVPELSSSLREWKKGIGGQILTRLNEVEYRVDNIEYERDHQSPYGKSLQQWEDSK